MDNLQLKLDVTGKIKVLWVVESDPLRVAGRNTFVNKLIELAGGENAVGHEVFQYSRISTEQLINCEADVIIQSSMGTSSISEQQQAAEAFWDKRPNLAAVKNNRIYVVDSDMVFRLGPRLPQSVEMIANCLYPEIFNQKPAAVHAR